MRLAIRRLEREHAERAFADELADEELNAAATAIDDEERVAARDAKMTKAKLPR